MYAGKDALEQVVQMDSIDMVLTAMVGYSGLLPTLKAIRAGKHIALANKETLVVVITSYSIHYTKLYDVAYANYSGK